MAAMKSINVNKEVVFRFPGDKEQTEGGGSLSFPGYPNPPSLRTWRGSNCLSGALSKLGGPLFSSSSYIDDVL